MASFPSRCEAQSAFKSSLRPTIVTAIRIQARTVFFWRRRGRDPRRMVLRVHQSARSVDEKDDISRMLYVENAAENLQPWRLTNGTRRGGSYGYCPASLGHRRGAATPARLRP